MEALDRSKVRNYFIGKSMLGPTILLILGLCTLVFGIGLFLLIGALIWFLINKFGADTTGEQEADKARAFEIKKATQAALDKLNVIADQVQNVEPVIVYGRGFEPESITSQALAAAKSSQLKVLSRSLLKKSDDPIYLQRIGSDNQLRYSLVCVTVFMFGEEQLYIYNANVDITTGLVYSESTHEYFYSDINAVTFRQDKDKVLNIKTKKFERKLFESVIIYCSGCSYRASLSSELEHSIVDTQFRGMRNLIREKKATLS